MLGDAVYVHKENRVWHAQFAHAMPKSFPGTVEPLFVCMSPAGRFFMAGGQMTFHSQSLLSFSGLACSSSSRISCQSTSKAAGVMRGKQKQKLGTTRQGQGRSLEIGTKGTYSSKTSSFVAGRRKCGQLSCCPFPENSTAMLVFTTANTAPRRRFCMPGGDLGRDRRLA